MNEQNDNKENEPASKDKGIERAWAYHQNADVMQHQRHIIFILTQTIFFTGFVTSVNNPMMQWLVLILGTFFAFLWWRVAENLEKRLDAMRSILKQDWVWEQYIEAAPQKARFGGHNVFNKWLPGLIFIAWMYLLLSLIF